MPTLLTFPATPTWSTSKKIEHISHGSRSFAHRRFIFSFHIKDNICYVAVMKIGYARVSTQRQKLDRQIAALRAAGVGNIYCEKASGKSIKGRPQLDKAIDALDVGDVLVIAEWDRATRSMTDGLDIIARVAERKAAVKVLDRDYIDLTSTTGKGILAFLSALALDERERIVKRAADGRQAAVKRGVKFGPKPKLTDHQRAVALKRLAAGDSCKTIADDMGVSKATIWRVQA